MVQFFCASVNAASGQQNRWPCSSSRLSLLLGCKHHYPPALCMNSPCNVKHHFAHGMLTSCDISQLSLLDMWCKILAQLLRGQANPFGPFWIMETCLRKGKNSNKTIMQWKTVKNSEWVTAHVVSHCLSGWLWFTWHFNFKFESKRQSHKHKLTIWRSKKLMVGYKNIYKTALCPNYFR